MSAVCHELFVRVLCAMSCACTRRAFPCYKGSSGSSSPDKGLSWGINVASGSLACDHSDKPSLHAPVETSGLNVEG